MLVNQNSSRNWNAVSAVNVDIETKQGTPVMYMNASYNGREVTFGQNIQNMELYLTNKATVDADYETFKSGVLEDIGE